MTNNDEQFEEYEIYFYTFIFEEEANKELKKNDTKEKYHFGFNSMLQRDNTHLSLTFMKFCHLKQDISSLLPSFSLSPI